ncbi:MAG: hypothetical protein ACRDRQ_25440, partial [Pseudonocardiaceae bacterium]
PEERRVFIGTTLEGEEALKGGTDAPGKWGLVLLNFPFQREGVLTMTTLSSRTDWSEDGKRRQLATAGQLHKKIEFLLRRHLRFSIWACNLKTKKCEEYSDVGYTKNVEIFAKKGGKLKQEGVANIEFFLTRP